MGERLLICVRHGQAEEGEPPDGWGHGGPPLSALGRAQAELAARRLAGLRAAAIYHSDLRRAAETAALIGAAIPGAPLRPTPLLRECVPCVPPDMAARFADMPHDRRRRHERQARRAYQAFFRPAEAAGEVVLLVCHGNLIRSFACRALRVPLEAWARMDLFTAAVCEILVPADGRARLISLNDSGHLPIDMRTY